MGFASDNDINPNFGEACFPHRFSLMTVCIFSSLFNFCILIFFISENQAEHFWYREENFQDILSPVLHDFSYRKPAQR